MFDKKKQQDPKKIQKPGDAGPEVLKNIKVATIPPEFYDGGLGNGKAHSSETDKPKKVAAKPKPPVKKPEIKPEAKEPMLAAQAPTVKQVYKKSHTGLIVGLIILILLIVGGGFAYWNFVLNVEPEPAPIVIEPEPEPELEPEPEPEPELELEPEPEPVVPVYPIGLREYQLSLDTDSDNLTDIEENQIYGSDPMRPDDDSDGFIDGHEVFHLYNPAARAPVDLIDSGLVSMYRNDTFGYEMYYPKSWVVDSVDANGQDVLFTSATGEFIESLVHPNEELKALEEWYASRAPKVSADAVRSISTKRGLVGMLSPDSLTFFVARDELVYELRYDIGVRVDANFMRTFVMMQNSLMFTSEPLYVPDEIVEDLDELGLEPIVPIDLFDEGELIEPEFDEDDITGLPDPENLEDEKGMDMKDESHVDNEDLFEDVAPGMSTLPPHD